jgi:hypothetical protein
MCQDPKYPSAQEQYPLSTLDWIGVLIQKSIGYPCSIQLLYDSNPSLDECLEALNKIIKINNKNIGIKLYFIYFIIRNN